MVYLDALGARGPFRAQNRSTITDVTGTPLAELSLVPPVFVTRTMSALRRASTPATDDRIGMIARAGELFATATLGGQSVDEYQHMVSRVSGIPVTAVRESTGTIATRLSRVYFSIQHARPAGAVGEVTDPMTRTGRAVWVRRGSVFAVQAAGNHPGPHGAWPEALALGYRVAVRPSQREPFTPHRLITALRSAGFPDDTIALLPTGHDHAEAVLRDADRSMVYGGEAVVSRYRDSATVLPQGPGRSKILITREVDWRDHLETLVHSVSRHGGVGCINTTTILVEGDPEPLCAALAERLASLPGLPPCDDRAVLPVQPLAAATALAGLLLRHAGNARPWLGGEGGIVEDLGDGSAVLRPAVHQLDRPDAPQAGVELPFPCVWVAGWTPSMGVAPLRGSLALTVMTRQRHGFVEDLLNEPTIGNLYLGDYPTWWASPELPHDGYLAEFLMRTKTVIRD